MKTLTKSFKLNNGIQMPCLGFGTFEIEKDDAIRASILEALNVGYRHIDTASMYKNEEGIGNAIKESDVLRREIFLTSKVWNGDHGYDSTLKAFEASLKKLKTDYLDLYLIHWPKNLNKETWKALERLYDEKLIRAIGVSNFKVHHLNEIMRKANICPMVNQVEFHPQLQNKEVLDFCLKNNIQVEAWGPLMQGEVFSIDLMKDLAIKYNKTISQITLRWDIQMGVVAIPKSVTKSRIKENTEIFDFEISLEDMEKIASLNKEKRIGPDPDEITF
ncbi:aldo/keto reductase [Clostridium algidicarnis]|uniref:Diketogulonate reductase-like aldo/keto reductase n=1 Tax=Clostridium algidicarnis DSM 15099 TaxID=1121295 RepID=A0A2S6FXH4_9CLOT|nr:aldo/keto reductase [Clostridium algidicarnis]PPK48261.1 diketogulonate reductase-like aldo/keto reductase [Clostridium algidicarnis DSM 15099]